MATIQKEIKAEITAGPSELQLVFSLLRKSMNPYGIDMDRATAVGFITEFEGSGIYGFMGTINDLKREDGSGNSWMIEGYTISFPDYRTFKGFFNTKTREGHVTIMP